MRTPHLSDAFTQQEAAATIRTAIRRVDSTAGAQRVNRTHRVVRERAQILQARRSRMRGLLLPLILCSSLMIMVFAAFWVVLEQYEGLTAEPATNSHHLFLLLLWFVPVSGALLALVWFRRIRNNSDSEAMR